MQRSLVTKFPNVLRAKIDLHPTFGAMSAHEQYMQQCLELAAKGLGSVAPNPMVGSVVVHNGNIIGQGYHQQYGGPHAEVNAVNSVAEKSLLKDSTIYVNLEPCAHYGQTPPCAELIASLGIPNVVVGHLDPNPLVAGKGVAILEGAGCKVTHGVLAEAGRALNKRFLTFFEQKRPYVILKWAQSSDGFIDAVRSTAETPPVWITSPASKTLVHQWRSEEPAILVGTNTALLDNPRLNVREVNGTNPTRVVLDLNGRLPDSLHLFAGEQPTLVISKEAKASGTNLEYATVNSAKPLVTQVLDALYQRKLQSVIVEGGSQTLQAFLDANAWDEARVFTGITGLGSGLKAPRLAGTPVATATVGMDRLEYFSNA